MRNRIRHHNHLSRWIMLLLAALMILSIALARQGYGIARSQQQVIDALLHDYAQLIADNYARALLSRIGFEHIYQLVRDFGSADLLQANQQTWPVQQANAIAKQYLGHPLQAAFQLSSDGEPSVLLYGQPNDANEHARRWWSATQVGFSQPFHTLHWRNQNNLQSLLLVPTTTGNDIIGLLLNPASINDLISMDADSYQLLPPALADSDTIRAFVHIQLKDPDQQAIYTTNNYRDNSNKAIHNIVDDYAGLFNGFSITTSIDRQAVPLLAIGQQANTDLSTIVILMGMTLILGCSALLLLWRERKLNALRKDFVARVSHELRTPLTQIRMYAESILFNRIPAKSEQTRALQVIHRETQRLSHIVENVLRFSGSNGQQQQKQSNDYPMHQLLQHLREDFTPMLNARQVDLKIDCAVSINSQYHRESVLQIIGNLIDNALKFGPDKQTLSLQVKQTDRHLKLCLSDQGPGIPTRYHKQVFQAYFRLAREQQRAIAGTGIGLSVAAEMAQQLDGTLLLKTTSDNGCCFCLSLPK